MTDNTVQYRVVIVDNDGGRKAMCYVSINDGPETEYDIIKVKESVAVAIFDGIFFSPYRNLKVSFKATTVPKQMREVLTSKMPLGAVSKSVSKKRKRLGKLCDALKFLSGN